MVRNWPANALIGSKCDVFFEKLKHREFRNSLFRTGEGRRNILSPLRDDTLPEDFSPSRRSLQIARPCFLSHFGKNRLPKFPSLHDFYCPHPSAPLFVYPGPSLPCAARRVFVLSQLCVINPLFLRS